MRTHEIRMTEGPIASNMIRFAIPLFLGNLFQQLYNAVDSVIVGQFVSSQALAAVGSSFPLINLLISFFIVKLMVQFLSKGA